MKKRLSKVIATVLCLVSMVALLPSTAFAYVYITTNPVIFEIGTYKVSGEVVLTGYAFTLPSAVTGTVPAGLNYRGYGIAGIEFYGTALPGTASSNTLTITDSTNATGALTITVIAGPQTIVQPDISKSISDGSFTVTPQSKDGNGDVIDVAAIDPALVAQHQPTYTFSSSDPSIATINSTTGEVTLIAEGTTTITVNSAATESYTAASAITFVLTVTPDVVDPPVVDPPVVNPPADKGDTNVAKTGDSTTIWPSAIVGIAALGLLILLVNRKKKKA